MKGNRNLLSWSCSNRVARKAQEFMSRISSATISFVTNKSTETWQIFYRNLWEICPGTFSASEETLRSKAIVSFYDAFIIGNSILKNSLKTCSLQRIHLLTRSQVCWQEEIIILVELSLLYMPFLGQILYISEREHLFIVYYIVLYYLIRITKYLVYQKWEIFV